MQALARSCTCLEFFYVTASDTFRGEVVNFIRTKKPTKTAKISNSGNFVLAIEKMVSLSFSSLRRLVKVVTSHYRRTSSVRQDFLADPETGK